MTKSISLASCRLSPYVPVYITNIYKYGNTKNSYNTFEQHKITSAAALLDNKCNN